jgi:hypothetical protein
MAEEPKGTQTAPVESLPEPDLDSLLSSIPLFKDAFGPGEKSGDETTQPDQSTEPDSEAPEAPVEPPSETPAEEETPPEESPPEEEAKPELSDSVQKRIDKLTAQRKTAEEKAATLEAELNDLKGKYQAPPPVVPTPFSPLANVETKAELGKRMELAQQAKTWAIENLDGGEVDLGDGKTKWLDGREVKVILAKAETMITKHVPERNVFLDLKTGYDADAQKSYPLMFKAGTKEQQEYNSWLTVFPECRKYPDIALIVGDAMVGRQVRLAKTAGKSGKNGNGQAPPLSAPQPASAPRVPKSRVLSGEELSSIATDTSGKALDKFVDQLIAGGAEQRAQRSKR